MVRTDDDSWDITEGVGQTALGVAMARADEAGSSYPLFTDPYAQLFIGAATARGWQPPSGAMVERIRSLSGYAASRTKWFDEFFIAAGANGVEQVVILAAGLDARAWRLPWVDGTVVYEVDLPKVLGFKAEILRAHDAEPGARYVQVPVDLRQDWPKALRNAGFDPTEPVAWAAEGLLPDLPADSQELLFERIHQLSRPNSRLAVESFGADFFDPEYLASRREQMCAMRAGDEPIPDTEDLWFIEERADVADWLAEKGWEVTAIEALDLMNRYGRCGPARSEAVAPRTVFVDARLVC